MYLFIETESHGVQTSLEIQSRTILNFLFWHVFIYWRGRWARATAPGWKLENNMKGSVLSFYPPCGSRDCPRWHKTSKEPDWKDGPWKQAQQNSIGWAAWLDNRRNHVQGQDSRAGLTLFPDTTWAGTTLVQRADSNICYKTKLRNREAPIMLESGTKLE